MKGVRRSLLLSAFESYLSVALQLASTVIVSRLLAPSDVGVFAIAAVFAALASTFRDFGIAEYLIQEKQLTDDKIRAAFALNVMISWAMAAALAGLSPLVAGFYASPGVGEVMRIQALNFLLVPFGAITLAWFRRELDYRPIVISNLLSNVTAFAVAVSLAAAGWGYLSLAWSSFAGILAVVAAATWFRPATLPRWPALRGVREVFHFGKFTSVTYILIQIGKGAPELIIGRARGVVDVGLFSRASGLLEMFNRLLMRPLLQVCLPYFAQENRETGTLEPAYRRSVAMLTAAGWPFLGALGVMSFVAIRVVYGPQWVDAAPVATVVCLAGALELSYLLAREALVAKGEARRATVMQAQILASQATGLVIGVQWGLGGAAWGLVAAALAGLTWSTWHLRAIGVRPQAIAQAALPSLPIAAAVVLPLVAAAWMRPPGESNHLWWALGGALYTATAWLLALRLSRHLLWDEMAATVARLLARRNAAS